MTQEPTYGAVFVASHTCPIDSVAKLAVTDRGTVVFEARELNGSGCLTIQGEDGKKDTFAFEGSPRNIHVTPDANTAIVETAGNKHFIFHRDGERNVKQIDVETKTMTYGNKSYVVIDREEELMNAYLYDYDGKLVPWDLGERIVAFTTCYYVDEWGGEKREVFVLTCGEIINEEDLIKVVVDGIVIRNICMDFGNIMGVNKCGEGLKLFRLSGRLLVIHHIHPASIGLHCPYDTTDWHPGLDIYMVADEYRWARASPDGKLEFYLFEEEKVIKTAEIPRDKSRPFSLAPYDTGKFFLVQYGESTKTVSILQIKFPKVAMIMSYGFLIEDGKIYSTIHDRRDMLRHFCIDKVGQIKIYWVSHSSGGGYTGVKLGGKIMGMKRFVDKHVLGNMVRRFYHRETDNFQMLNYLKKQHKEPNLPPELVSVVIDEMVKDAFKEMGI